MQAGLLRPNCLSASWDKSHLVRATLHGPLRTACTNDIAVIFLYLLGVEPLAAGTLEA